jgi:putative serine protease PepD
MVDDDRRRGGVDPDDPPVDYRYFGPYDLPPRQAVPPPTAEETAPLGIGAWGSEDDDATAPQAGPFFAPHPSMSTTAFRAPPAVGSLATSPRRQSVSTTPRRARSVRLGVVVLVAALTALLIGTAAGYVGSRLGAPQQTSAASSAAPVATPGAVTSTSTGPLPATRAPKAMNGVAVARAALPSTVMIRITGGGDTSVGSGFVLNRNGLVMTNNHVVAGATNGGTLRVVFPDGATASATLVGRSPTYDIAVIRVDTSHALVPLAIGNSDDTQVGESVLAIGSPLALPGTVTEGIVSATNRPVAVGQKGNTADAYINGTQTDAPINPGNSGGPLIDAGGRVIGVNSAILTLNNDQSQAGNIGIGFAIPVNQAMQVGTMLIANGKATYPVIGADVADTSDQSGVQLTKVTPGGPADQAGLRTGDVVVDLNGHPVVASDELIVAIRSHRPGERVTVTYRRSGHSQVVAVVLGSREG